MRHIVAFTWAWVKLEVYVNKKIGSIWEIEPIAKANHYENSFSPFHVIAIP